MNSGITTYCDSMVKILWQTPNSLPELKQYLKSIEPLIDKPNKKSLRKECFSYLSKLIANGKISPEKIIQTGFFQSMSCEKRSCQFSRKIDLVASAVLPLIDAKNPSLEIKQWFSGLLWDIAPRDRLIKWAASPSFGVKRESYVNKIEGQPKVIFPETNWEMNPHSSWDPGLLEGIKQFAKKQKSQALMIVQGGKIIDQLGDPSEKHLVYSCRKSFLSALFGIYIDQGIIDLSKTLKDLGVNDISSLSQNEQLATLLDMMRSRSGVYHPAAYETQAMKEARPKRGSHAPGEFWYYNNWDFNTLGRIFEELTGVKIFDAIETLIAKPIGMEDFTAVDGVYGKEPQSESPSYDFFMSARDMARFGYLFLRGGRWKDQQIIPKEWVTRSTTAYTQGASNDKNPFDGYALMWWTNEYGYYALGYGGHTIAVIPSKDLVIVHRSANDNRDDPNQVIINPHTINTILRMIIEAAPE